MARTLPNQPEVSSARNLAHLCIAFRIPAQRIGIEQHGPDSVGCVIVFSSDHAPLGKFDESQEIAATRSEANDIEMDILATGFKQPTQQSAITLLALALAAEKDTTTLWAETVAHRSHPSCGTAPYTPPEYLR